MLKVLIGVLLMLLRIELLPLSLSAISVNLYYVETAEVEVAETQEFAGRCANQAAEANAQASVEMSVQDVCNAVGIPLLALVGIVSYDDTITDPRLLNAVETMAEGWRSYCAPNERPIRIHHRVVR